MSLNKNVLDGIIDAIHSEPQLTGVVVGLYSGQKCSIAYAGDKVALPYWRFAVIIEVIDDDGQTVAVPPDPTDSPQPPAPVTNRSRIWAEFAGAGLNCGFAVVSGVGVAASLAAEVPTAGTSTFATVVLWGGAVTSSLQCVNAIVRSVAAVAHPDSDSISRWDENRLYSISFLIVDAFAVGFALASIRPAFKGLMAVLRSRGGLMATEDLLKLGRAARAKEIQRALAAAARNPEARKALQEALNEAGVSGRTLRRAAGNAVIAARNAEVISEVIAKETARRLTRAIVEVIAAGGTPVASALREEDVGAASGSVNAAGGLIAHVVGISAG